MRDNTKAKLDRGVKGFRRNLVSVESASRIVDSVAGPDGRPTGPDRPGRRPAHTAGVFLSGTFTPDSEAATTFLTQIVEEESIDAVGRFSPTLMRSTNRGKDVHGLAVRLMPASTNAAANAKDLTDLVAIDTEPLLLMYPDAFGNFIRNVRKGIRQALWALVGVAFETIAGRGSWLGIWNTVKSYLGSDKSLSKCRYSGIHTFFIDRKNSDGDVETIPFRYSVRFSEPSVVPKDSGYTKIRGRYLDLATLVGHGSSVELEIVLIIPKDADRLHPWLEAPDDVRSRLLDATRKWKHSDTTEVCLGTIELTKVEDKAGMNPPPSELAPGKSETQASPDDRWDKMVFDPMRLSSGLHASNDPILRARSTIYSESHWRTDPVEDA